SCRSYLMRARYLRGRFPVSAANQSTATKDYRRMTSATSKIEDTVARWHSEEEAVRARLSASVGSVRPAEASGRTGLELFDAIFAGELPRPPIGDTLDFVPIRIERGVAVFQGRPQQRHYNPLGTVHGGWFATLLDSAMWC